MLKKLLACSALALGFVASVMASEPEKWRNVKIYEINREPAHAEFTSYTNRAAALQPLNLANPWSSELYRSLNGVWDFNWYGDMNDVPEDWFSTDTKVKEWGEIPVPGAWQIYGYDKLCYTSPCTALNNMVNMKDKRPEFQGEEREKSLSTGFVPDEFQRIGCYRQWVDISKDDLRSNSVILRIGAAEAAIGVYVNGVEVGYSEDSFLPAEFEIAKYLKEGKNLIALKVYCWSDGTYLEIQDMLRWAGIYRDVFLKFNTAKSVRDIQFVGVPDSTLKTTVARYEVTVRNNTEKSWKKGNVKFELIPDGETKAVKSWNEPLETLKAGESATEKGTIELKDMKLWSPDVPNLYTLIATITNKDGSVEEVARIDAGFKRFENRDGNYFLNGKRYFIKGVNRHDHSAKTAHWVPIDELLTDAELMKQNNINTVRTSHYPNDERWYYICNRYGIAMLGEANVESHGFDDLPGNRPEWFDASVSRVTRMVKRDLNNPAILLWSLGNEQGFGWCKTFDLQYEAAKALDPTRYIMCDRGVNAKKGWEEHSPARLDKPDAVTPMYNAYVKAEQYLENRDKDRRPFFMCEYRHAMGNAVGSLKELWDLYYANAENGLNGGCIWDWVDQGVEAYDANGVKYYQYGGDWGEINSDYNFCLNGLLLSDRTPTPKLLEVKKCYEPFSVEAVDVAKGEFSVMNRLNQQSLSSYAVRWELIEDGSVVEGGVITSLDALPQESQTFKVPYNTAKMDDNKEYYVRVYFLLGEDTRWAKKGYEVTFSEFKVKGDYSYTYTANSLKPELSTKGTEVKVVAKNGVEMSFCKTTGLLTSMKVKGKELLAASSRDRLFDNSMAWIDNLYNFRRKMHRMARHGELNLEDIERVGAAVVDAKIEGNFAVVTIENTYMSDKNAGFKEVQRWKIDGLGEVELTESVEPQGELKAEDWIPRIGLRIPLVSSIDNVVYYGLGPDNNETDRKVSARTGLYSMKVGDMYIPYAFPQDHGNRVDVRWMQLSDNNGNGVKIITPEKLVLSALPYTQDELQAATHTIELPEAPTATELRVAAKVTGIGNASCGPLTDEEYRATAEAVEYKFYIIPFAL